jgi:putative SOS response-associated peptidase YedK
MCGRYTLATDLDELIEVFEVPAVTFHHEARYNIAPTQLAPVVARDRRGTRMGLMRWGLIPFWAEDPAIGNRQINARSESVHERRAFRDAFERRRCLVPADGFYEWCRRDGSKRPHWIHPVARSVMALAGVWERWRAGDGSPVHSFSILTRKADDQVAWVHDRMPVIVPARAYAAWLDRDADTARARALLERFEPPPLEVREVSTWVNRPDHDDPSCIEPLQD